MDKPRLCEVLGVEPNEMFSCGMSAPENYFQVNEYGSVDISHDRGRSWNRMANQTMLETMINTGIIKRPRLSLDQLKKLRGLNEVFGAVNLHKDAVSLFIQPSGKHDSFMRIPTYVGLDDLFDLIDIYKHINILDILEEYKEVLNV